MNSLVKLEKRDFIPNKLLITCLKIRESERSSFVTRDLLFIEVRSNVLLLYFFISLFPRFELSKLNLANLERSLLNSF